jgi:hypothetical protein
MKFFALAAAAAMMVVGSAEARGCKGGKSGKRGGGCCSPSMGCVGGGCGQSGFASSSYSSYSNVAYSGGGYSQQPQIAYAQTQPTISHGGIVSVPVPNAGSNTTISTTGITTGQLNPGERITLTIQDSTGRAIDQNGQIFMLQPTQQNQAASPANQPGQNRQNLSIQPVPGTNLNVIPSTNERRENPQNSTSNSRSDSERSNVPNPPPPQR